MGKHYKTSKCWQCRKGKRLCSPTDRQWPPQKCTNCIRYNHDCSESLTTKEFKDSTVDGVSWRTVLVSPFCRQNLQNPHGSECRCQYYKLPMDCPPTNSDDVQNSAVGIRVDDRPMVPCSTNFSLLLGVSWEFFGIFASGSEIPGHAPIVEEASQGFCLHESSKAYSVFSTLQRRQELILLHDKWQNMFKSLQFDNGLPREGASTLATDRFLSDPANFRYPAAEIPGMEVIDIRRSQLFQGLRWRDLVDSVGFQEILLMNWTGSCKGYFMNLDNVIEREPDSEFEVCKQYLLSPGLRLRETLHRLRGLLALIHQLKDTCEHSQERKRFAYDIHRKIQAAFEEPQIDQTAIYSGGLEHRIGDDSQESGSESLLKEDGDYAIREVTAENSNQNNLEEEKCDSSDHGDYHIYFKDDYPDVCMNSNGASFEFILYSPSRAN